MNKLTAIFRGVANQKHTKNSFWNVLDLLVPPALLLLVSPICIKFLGDQAFGTWMLLYSFVGLIGAINLGLSDTAIKYGAEKLAAPSSLPAARLATNLLIMFVFLGTLTAGFFLCFSSWLVSHVFSVEPEFQDQATKSLSIGGLWVGLKLIENGVASLLKGAQRFDITGRVILAENLVLLTAAVALAVNGYGLLPILITGLMLVCLALVVLIVAVYRIFKLRLHAGAFKPSEIREFWQFSAWAWIQGIAGSVFNQSDKILVGSIIGVASLPVYVICLQIAQLIHALFAAATAFLFPLTSQLIAGDKQHELDAIFEYALAVLIPVVVGLTAFIYLAANPILALFFSLEFAENGAELLRLQVLAFSCLALSVVPYYLLNGAGLIRYNVIFAVTSATIIVIALPMFLNTYGMVGGGYARLLNFGVVAAYLLFAKFKVIPDFPWSVLARLLVGYLLPILGILWVAQSGLAETERITALMLSLCVSVLMVLASILIIGRARYAGKLTKFETS